MAKGKRTRNTEVSQKALSTINDIVAVCAQDGPAEATFKRVLTKLKKVIAFDAATVYLRDHTGGQLQEVASIAGPVAVLEFLTIEQGEGLTGWAADSGKPILLADRSGHHEFDPENDFGSFMSVPLIQCERTIGVLNLGSKTPGAFSETDVQLLSLVASQIALALENLRYQQELADLHQAIDKLGNQLKTTHTKPEPIIEAAEIKNFVARVNHDTNNALAILLGNVQCMLMDESVADQKTVSRLRRMERALMKINDANHRLLDLVRIANQHDDSAAKEQNSKEKVLTKNV